MIRKYVVTKLANGWVSTQELELTTATVARQLADELCDEGLTSEANHYYALARRAAKLGPVWALVSSAGDNYPVLPRHVKLHPYGRAVGPQKQYVAFWY